MGTTINGNSVDITSARHYRARLYYEVTTTDSYVSISWTMAAQMKSAYAYTMSTSASYTTASGGTSTKSTSGAATAAEYNAAGAGVWFTAGATKRTWSVKYTRGSSDYDVSCSVTTCCGSYDDSVAEDTVTIPAVEIKTITVTYDANGGDDAPGDQEVDQSTTFSLAGSASWDDEEGDTYSCTISGGDGEYSGSTTRTCKYTKTHTFLGWSKSSTATTATWTATGTVSGGFSSDTTLYAVWKNGSTHDYFYWPAASAFSHESDTDNFTITGDGNGGYEVSETATKTTPYNISSTLVSDYGSTYTFGGYDYLISSEDGCTVYPTWSKGTTTYSNNTVGGLGSTTKDDDTEDGYLIKFDGNPTELSEDDIQAEIDNTYTFNGWWSAKSGGTQYADSKQFYTDTTVYAHWTKSQTSNAVNLPTEETRPGYEFLGWALSSTSKTAVANPYDPGVPSSPGTIRWLYAIWKAKGLARIWNGSKYQMALVYIWDGSKYRQAIPYIYDGTDYKIGG